MFQLNDENNVEGQHLTVFAKHCEEVDVDNAQRPVDPAPEMALRRDILGHLIESMEAIIVSENYFVEDVDSIMKMLAE